MRRLRLPLVLLSLVSLVAASAAFAQPTVTPRWVVSLGGVVGTPTGSVQVRENQVEGTRLDFADGLGLDRTWMLELQLRRRLGHRSALRFVVQSYTLDGAATPSGDVQFNGSTLAGGATLYTSTHFPSFVRATLTGEHELRAVGQGMISGAVGLTFVSLIFRVHGTLAPTTSSQETKEDFVTQELPVPVVGLAFAHPLTRRLDTEASALMGYLPWVNSLRHEGGTVMLRQQHLDLALDVAYSLSPAFLARVGYRYSSFSQHEESNEDGNDITFAHRGPHLELAWGF